MTRRRPGIPPDETGGVVAARNRWAQKTVPLPGYRQMEGTLKHPPGRAERRLHASREYASTAGGDASVVGCTPPVLQRQRAAEVLPGQMAALALHRSLPALFVLNLCVLCVSAVPFLCASVVRV